MGTITETSNFDATVYELETTDLVLGGPAGPSNAAAINLTNRTRWLFDQNTTNVATLATHSTHLGVIDGEITSINSSISSINVHLASIDSQLPLLAPINSPSFTGAPRAPTPGATNDTRIATTAFVQGQIAGLAPLNSPGFTGVPTAPTAAAGTSTSQLATTAFVNRGASIGTNGYRKNPDGTIEQWGFANPAGGGITVSFPTSFPSACLSLVAISVAGGAVQTWLGANPGASSFNLHNSGGTSFWKAIGD